MASRSKVTQSDFLKTLTYLTFFRRRFRPNWRFFSQTETTMLYIISLSSKMWFLFCINLVRICKKLCRKVACRIVVVGEFPVFELVFTLFLAPDWPSSRCQILAILVFLESLRCLLSNKANFEWFTVLSCKLQPWEVENLRWFLLQALFFLFFWCRFRSARRCSLWTKKTKL